MANKSPNPAITRLCCDIAELAKSEYDITSNLQLNAPMIKILQDLASQRADKLKKLQRLLKKNDSETPPPPKMKVKHTSSPNSDTKAVKDGDETPIYDFNAVKRSPHRLPKFPRTPPKTPSTPRNLYDPASPLEASDPRVQFGKYEIHPAYPVLVREIGESVWTELACDLCHGNAVPFKSGLRFLTGVSGVMTHMNHGHGLKATTEQVVGLCEIAQYTDEQVEDMTLEDIETVAVQSFMVD